MQIDLVDYGKRPDGQYKYILHIKHHFSRFSSFYPLKSKKAAEVAERMAEWIGMIGIPRLLQCDNGGEFKEALLVLLKEEGVKIINGRLCHPQTRNG